MTCARLFPRLKPASKSMLARRSLALRHAVTSLPSKAFGSLFSIFPRKFSGDVQEFRTRLAQGLLGLEFRATYLRIRATCANASPAATERLSTTDISTAMTLLANSPFAQDAELANEIFRDIHKLGFEVKQAHYCIALQAMAKLSCPAEALKLLEAAPPHMSRRVLWEAALLAFRQHSNIPAIRTLIESQAHITSGVSMEQSYRQLLLAIIDQPTSPDAAAIDSVLQEMRDHNVRTTAITVAVLRRGIRRGLVPSTTADEILSAFGKQIYSNAVWLDKITAARCKSNRATLMKIVRDMKARGLQPDDHILRAVITDESTATELGSWENLLGVKPNVFHWSNIVYNAVQQRGAKAALDVYNFARHHGVSPISALTQPILSALLRRGLMPPSPRAIDTAMRLYRDLRDNGVQQPDATVYRTLLHAISNSTTVANSMPLADELIADMRARNIQLDDGSVISAALMCISSASSHHAAFAAFRTFIESPSGTSLTLHGYMKALRLLCYSAFPGVPHLAPEVFFEFLREMTWRGHAFDSHAYVMLLSRYAALGVQCKRQKPISDDDHAVLINSNSRRCDDLVEIHARLLLDTTITADVATQNALMKAYQMNDMFDDADKLWRVLEASGSYDSVSVSTIFDACGFGQRFERGNEIHESLKRRGYELNTNNRTAWIECLCRCHSLQAAMRFVLNDVPDCSLDACVDVLLHFAEDKVSRQQLVDRMAKQIPNAFQRYTDRQRKKPAKYHLAASSRGHQAGGQDPRTESLARTIPESEASTQGTR